MELSITKEKLSVWSVIGGLVFLIVVSSFISFLFVGLDFFKSFQKHLGGVIYGFFVGLSFWTGNYVIGWITGSRLNWKKNPQRANTISLLLFITYGILASISVPWIYQIVYYKKTDQILNTVIINGFINLSIDIIFVSMYYSKYLVRYYAQSLRSEEELKRENLVARYEALKNQVNPHFLFNSLNTLSGVVEQNPEKAVEYIKKLSDIYRYVLDQRDKELVHIEEELKFVADYIHLAKIRHGNGLELKQRITAGHNWYIAPLGLQILVENAIKHNIISDDMPLVIEIENSSEYLTVKNNSQKKSTVVKSNSIGLENLKNRYTLLSDKPVQIIDGDNYFMVKLPIIESKHI